MLRFPSLSVLTAKVRAELAELFDGELVIMLWKAGETSESVAEATSVTSPTSTVRLLPTRVCLARFCSMSVMVFI
jgi:hypothetical protein